VVFRQLRPSALWRERDADADVLGNADLALYSPRRARRRLNFLFQSGSFDFLPTISMRRPIVSDLLGLIEIDDTHEIFVIRLL
jgi:hypothetical protein